MIKEYLKKHGCKWLNIILLISVAVAIVTAIGASVQMYKHNNPIRACENCGRYYR